MPVTLEVLPGGGQVHDPFLALADAWLQILVLACRLDPQYLLAHPRPTTAELLTPEPHRCQSPSEVLAQAHDTARQGGQRPAGVQVPPS
ncbi:hypothetical protein OG322_40105 [Streptomyces sp. NBC_01260]|uniref:hypothetical protein n=1 Tax=Streptomyces sp. NBC_01260 TaxID=2903801 RepID=UPI002E30B5AF|nr:hypothetical protein [Streptomyces sp. NBC_01260]